MHYSTNHSPKYLASLLSCAVLCSAVSPVFAESASNASQQAFEEAADTLFWDIMASSPISVHYSFSEAADCEIPLDNPLGIFAETNDDTLEILERAKAALSEVRPEELTVKQKRVYNRMLEFIDDNYYFCTLPDYSNTLGPMNGILTTMDTMITEYYILSEEDAQNYIALLKDIPRFLGEIVKELEYQEGLGYVPGKYTYDTFLAGREHATTLEGHIYLEAFRSNLAESGLSEEQTADYISQATEVLSQEVIPAFSDFYDLLEEKSATAGESMGLSHYENGREYYEALVKDNTGTDMSPSELMEYLEDKVQTGMQDISLLYFTDPDAFTEAESLTVPAADADACLQSLKQFTTENMPSAELPDYILSYLPEALEVPSNLAYYLSSPIDNPERNVIRINGSEVKDDAALLWTTMAHEGYPGHLYQHQYFMQNSFQYNIETLLDSIGTTEGWANYVEKLSLEWAGIDENTADIYFMDMILGMALMSIIDIGVNYEGWGTDEIGDYLKDYYGELPPETLQEFLDTLAGDPAVFLPYSVGYYQTEDIFSAIRGNYSSDRDMYEAYLKLGNLPFTQLKIYLGADGSI